MTDLKFPSNPKKRNKDFTVPLGDILSREGKKVDHWKWVREFLADHALTIIALGFLLSALMYLWANISLGAVRSAEAAEKAELLTQNELLRAELEKVVREYD